MKKVLGLIASPRKGGNSELAVREILQRFPDGEGEKGMIRLTDLDIAYCRACYACLPRGKGCVIADDMAFLIDRIREADKIILASATYIQGGHTDLKRVRDRTLPLIADFKAFTGKDCVLVGSYGIKHWDGLLLEDLIVTANELCLTIVDSEMLCATLPGEAVSGENLVKVQRLAESLYTGKAPEKETDELLCPYCGARGLRLHKDGRWKCLLCAGSGTLQQGPAGFSLRYDPADIFNHYTPQTKRWHIRFLEDQKQLFREKKEELKGIRDRYIEEIPWLTPEKT